MGQFDTVVTFIVDTFFLHNWIKINPYCTHGFANSSCLHSNASGSFSVWLANMTKR